MKRKNTLIYTLTITLVFLAQQLAAQEVQPDIQKNAENKTSTVWELGDLYPDIASWNSAREEIAARINTLDQCKGKLGSSADKLAECMTLINNTHKDLLHLYVYSFLAKDTDLGNSENRERASSAQTLLTQLGEATSYVDPELVAIDEKKLNRFLKNSNELKDYDFSILNTRRQAKHILSPKEERIIAASYDALSTASNAYEVLTNAEMPWPEITLSNGETVRLDASGYGKSRTSESREDRRKVFKTFWEVFQNYRQTLAITLEGQVKADVLVAKLRGFDSSLQRALDNDNIPEEVYRALVNTVNDKIDSLHRLISLRQRMLKIDETEYFDIYPSVISLDKS